RVDGVSRPAGCRPGRHRRLRGLMTNETRRAVEAILMVADQPIEAQLLAQVTETPVEEMEALLREMAGELAEGHGYVLVEVAGGWRFQSHPDLAPYVERF